MSTLNEEIARLESAKEAIKAKLIEKGVDIPENALLDNYADLIGSIKTGKSFNKVGEIVISDTEWHDIPVKILCDDSWRNSLNSIYFKIINVDGDVSKVTDILNPQSVYGLIEYSDIIINSGYAGEYQEIGYRYWVEYGWGIHNDSAPYDGVLYCDINMDPTEARSWVKLINNDPVTILTIEYGYFE